MTTYLIEVPYTVASLELETGLLELSVEPELDEDSDDFVTYYTWTYRQRGDPSRYWRTCTSLRGSKIAYARFPHDVVLQEVRAAEQRLAKNVHDAFTD